MEKKRSIVDINNAPAEVLQKISDDYPNGYDHALVRFNNAKGDLVVAIPIETEDTKFLVKINVITKQQIQDDLDLDDLNNSPDVEDDKDDSDDEDDDGYGDEPSDDGDDDE